MFARVRLRVRQIDAAADGLLLDRTNGEMRRQEPALDVRVVGEARRKAEQLLIDVEMNGRLVVSGRHQDALVWCDLHAHHRRRVEVGEEDQHVILVLIALEVLEQRWTPRALLLQPFHFIVAAMRVIEDPLGVAVERVDIARAGVGESAHGDAAYAVGSFRVFVLPGDVVLCAGGQHLDVVLRRQPLGDEPAVILGAAENLGAVALDDKRDLQISALLCQTCSAWL